MDCDTYQSMALRTKVYPKSVSIIYPALGLAGEAGEVCNKIKKFYRGDKFNIENWNTGDYSKNRGDAFYDLKKAITEELGDVLWYLAVLADDLDIDLDTIAEANVFKLADRQKRKKLKGEGDNR